MLEYADMSRMDLIKDLLRMKQHIKDELERCKTCRAVITAEVEAGRRSRVARAENKKSDIIKLQKKGSYISPGRRSKLID